MEMEGILGRRVSVYWPAEEEWFEGIITEKGLLPTQENLRSSLPVGWKVEYDDGDVAWIPNLVDNVKFIDHDDEVNSESDRDDGEDGDEMYSDHKSESDNVSEENRNKSDSDDDSIDIEALLKETKKQQSFLDGFDSPRSSGSNDNHGSNHNGASQSSGNIADFEDTELARLNKLSLQAGASYAQTTAHLQTPIVPTYWAQHQPLRFDDSSDSSSQSSSTNRSMDDTSVKDHDRIAAIREEEEPEHKTKGPYVAGFTNKFKSSKTKTSRKTGTSSFALAAPETTQAKQAKRGGLANKRSNEGALSRRHHSINVQVYGSAISVRICNEETMGGRQTYQNLVSFFKSKNLLARVLYVDAQTTSGPSLNYMLRAKKEVITTNATRADQPPLAKNQEKQHGSASSNQGDKLEWQFSKGSFNLEVKSKHQKEGEASFSSKRSQETVKSSVKKLGDLLFVIYEQPEIKPLPEEFAPDLSRKYTSKEQEKAHESMLRSGLKFIGQSVVALDEVLNMPGSSVEGWLPLSCRDGSALVISGQVVRAEIRLDVSLSYPQEFHQQVYPAVVKKTPPPLTSTRSVDATRKAAAAAAVKKKSSLRISHAMACRQRDEAARIAMDNAQLFSNIQKVGPKAANDSLAKGFAYAPGMKKPARTSATPTSSSSSSSVSGQRKGGNAVEEKKQSKKKQSDDSDSLYLLESGDEEEEEEQVFDEEMLKKMPPKEIQAIYEKQFKKNALIMSHIDTLKIKSSHAQVMISKNKSLLTKLNKSITANTLAMAKSDAKPQRLNKYNDDSKHNEDDGDDVDDADAEFGTLDKNTHIIVTEMRPFLTPTFEADDPLVSESLNHYPPGSEDGNSKISGDEDGANKKTSELEKMEIKYAKKYYYALKLMHRLNNITKEFNAKREILHETLDKLKKVDDLKQLEISPGVLPPDHPLSLARNEIAKERAEVETLKVKISLKKQSSLTVASSHVGTSSDMNQSITDEIKELQIELKDAKEKLAKRQKKLTESEQLERSAQQELDLLLSEDMESKLKKSISALSRGLLCLKQKEDGAKAGLMWAEVEANHHALLVAKLRTSESSSFSSPSIGDGRMTTLDREKDVRGEDNLVMSPKQFSSPRYARYEKSELGGRDESISPRFNEELEGFHASPRRSPRSSHQMDTSPRFNEELEGFNASPRRLPRSSHQMDTSPRFNEELEGFNASPRRSPRSSHQMDASPRFNEELEGFNASPRRSPKSSHRAADNSVVSSSGISGRISPISSPHRRGKN